MFFSKVLAAILSTTTLATSIVASGLEVETSDQPTATATVSWEDKIQPYLLEIMEQESETSKIPVWLWMEDIDHDEAEREVFDRTGLREDNLSVISEPISQELAEDIAKLPEASSSTRMEVKEEFRDYLDRTKESRELEAERVDTYVRELRNVKKEMITEKTSNIFKTLGISEKDVISKDTLAPVYIVYLSGNDIERLARNPKVTAIYYYDMEEEFLPEDIDVSGTMDGSTINRIKSDIGLTGNGVNVGVIDAGKVENHDDITTTITYVTPSTNYYDDHSTNVARIAAGKNGVAPSASIYSASGDLATAIVSMINEDVSVANYSMGSKKGNTDYYLQIEIYVDYLSRHYNFLLVKSAGNDHSTVTTPGLAYNVLTVGGFYNKSTAVQSDDVMYFDSNYGNFGDNACAKPDLVADQSGVGTSYAAPFATGTIALLYELCPSLEAQPEAVKAILMSSCHRKVTPSSGDPTETMAEGITEHQGAGAIDPYQAVAIAGSGNYGYRTMSSSATQENINYKEPAYGSTGLNVSLAWSVNNPNSSTAGPEINLDLKLLRNGTVLGESSLANSSAEMVYVTPSSTATETNYTIQVNRSSATGTDVRYAYAFSVDNYRYQYEDEYEGIYFIRNKATGKYLTNSSNNIYQKSYGGGTTQQWLIKDGLIYSASTEQGKVAVGSELSTSYTRAIVSDTSGVSVKLEANQNTNQYNTSEQDGSIRLTNEDDNTVLSIYNNSTSTAAAAWAAYTSGNDYQSWYLESVAYQRGDVNTDGVITTTDSDIVLEYITGSRTLTECQKYLADVNGDGKIQSIDCVLIQRIVEGES